ncbi:VQ motif-containing protein 1-like [Asparagus officinalis]|uniref:VQ motif-containing protein 1-like n=1 Tax=Asparagus officinalis TaxID=4686 RepID=UPI00098DE46B|nr:VQ motif-containing protein 1-like [Asparagus officinalis]
MSSEGTQPTKVTIIETQFVEADASQFKMVVQKFTGKDSVMSSQGASCHGRENTQSNRRKRNLRAEAQPMAVGGEVDAFMVELLPSMEELYEFLRD